MLHAGVKAYGFNRLRILNRHWIGHRVGRDNRYELLWLCFFRTQPHLTTSWARSHCRHWRLSSEDIKSMHMLSKCCRRWSGCSHVYLGLNNHRNLQFGSPVLHIPLTKVVGCIPPTRLGQFVKLHLLLLKPLQAVLNCLDSVPITQPGWSSSLSLPSSVSSSLYSSSSTSCSSSELARSLRLCPIAFNISSNVFSGFPVVPPTFSPLVISFSFCIIAVSAYWTRFLATAVSLST